MAELSIIIVSYNTRDITLKCLDSVFDSIRGISYEVIVVDNASVDGSQQAVKQKHPAINLIVNAENEGFAHANNQAIRAAKANL